MLAASVNTMAPQNSLYIMLEANVSNAHHVILSLSGVSDACSRGSTWQHFGEDKIRGHFG
jgi:hypothetical protein